MKNKLLYVVFSLVIATAIITTSVIISNYFGRIAVFEPVTIKLSGIPANQIKQVRVKGYTPEGKEQPFTFNDSLCSFHSYYGFLGSISLRLPANLSDSIDSIHISSGRELFVYYRNQLDTAWRKSSLKKEGLVELQTPLSFKTKETKVRILFSTRYWQVTKVGLYIVLSFLILLLIIRIIIRKLKK